MASRWRGAWYLQVAGVWQMRSRSRRREAQPISASQLTGRSVITPQVSPCPCTVSKEIDFPRYNMKYSGGNVILSGIFHVVSCFPLHFMLYRGNLDYFLDSAVENICIMKDNYCNKFTKFLLQLVNIFSPPSKHNRNVRVCGGGGRTRFPQNLREIMWAVQYSTVQCTIT